MIGDGRPEDGPPRDELAETIVLGKLLIRPTRIDGVDLSQLFLASDNRLCWRSMVFARTEYPDVLNTADPTWDGFFNSWLTGLSQDKGESLRLAACVVCCSDEFLRAMEERSFETEYDDPDTPLRPVQDYYHPYEWWVARLQHVRQARGLISAAQEISEHAWRVPERSFTVDEAVTMLKQIPTGKDVYTSSGMDIPV